LSIAYYPHVVIEDTCNVGHLPHRTRLVSDRDLDVCESRQLKPSRDQVQKWFVKNLKPASDSVENESYNTSVIRTHRFY
jgi:hypothetical protein